MNARLTDEVKHWAHDFNSLGRAYLSIVSPEQFYQDFRLSHGDMFSPEELAEWLNQWRAREEQPA